MTYRARTKDEVCTEFGKNVFGMVMSLIALVLAASTYRVYGDAISDAPLMIVIATLIEAVIALAVLPYEIGWFIHNRNQFSSKEIDDLDFVNYWLKGASRIGILIGVAGLAVFLVIETKNTAYMALLNSYAEKYFSPIAVLLIIGGLITCIVIAVLIAAIVVLIAVIIKKIIPVFMAACKKFGCIALRPK